LDEKNTTPGDICGPSQMGEVLFRAATQSGTKSQQTLTEPSNVLQAPTKKNHQTKREI
jgi:hypothetical protein